MAQKLGDFEARALFGEVYQAHGPAILGYALRRTSNDAAQDIAAETFLVAWRRIDEVPKDPLPWLLGVARRVLANQRRSATRAEALRTRLRGTERALTTGEARSFIDTPLHRALRRLSSADRELLALIAWEGLTPAQAALVLGISRVALRVRLHRAKRRLLACLELEEPTPFLAQLHRTQPARERP